MKEIRSIIFACTLMLSACAHTETPVIPAADSGTKSISDDAGKVSENMDAPKFSAESGFYPAPFTLTLSAESGAAVYYTTDGTEPTENSTLYTAPISVSDRSPEPDIFSAIPDIIPPDSYPEFSAPLSPSDKAAVIKAVSIGGNGERSRVSSRTYYIGFESKAAYYREFPVISLTVDEADLFGHDKGIYVLGKTYDDWKNSAGYDPEEPVWSVPANYTQHGKEWERPAKLEIFENGSLVLSQETGIRIHGGATRSYSQKSLNIYARKAYGSPKIEYDIFKGGVKNSYSGDAITEFDSFMLRNGGNDAFYTRFRDKLAQTLVSHRQFLTQGMRPCTVFINGEFWGHYEITEKIDAEYIETHCGVPEKNVCIVKKDALDEGSGETFREWEELREWINAADLSDDAEYEKLCGKIDMNCFTEYMCAEIYINNANWGASNSAMWRAEEADESSKFADGKWRFIMFDTDFSSGIYGNTGPSDDTFEKILGADCFISDLFRGALENEGFRRVFRNTFTDIALNDFDSEKVAAMIDSYESSYHDMVTDTFDRFWGNSIGGEAAEETYRYEVALLRDFYAERAEHILGYLDVYVG